MPDLRRSLRAPNYRTNGTLAPMAGKGSNIMKCLSVRVPWVYLTRDGRKPIELRSRSTAYRGTVILCAGRTIETRWGAEKYDTGPVGVTVCAAELVDVTPITPATFRKSCVIADIAEFNGWYAWHWRNIRRVPSLPYKGQLGLVNALPDLVSALGI